MTHAYGRPADSATDSLIGVMVQLCDIQGARGFHRRAAGAVALVSGGQIPSLNTLLVHDEQADPDTVADLLDSIAKTGLPHCVQTRPTVTEPVRRMLAQRGLTVRLDMPLMLWHGIQPPLVAPGHLSVRRITSGQMREHVQVAAEGFGVPPEIFAAVMTDDALDLPAIRCYLGEIDGAAVTTGLGATHGGWVGVFNIATPRAHRRRGYGAAVTARILEDALALGIDQAYLQSSEAGVGVYERLGFHTVESWSIWM